MRPTMALVAAAAVAAGQAVILGEYPFEGLTVLAAAVVFGLFVAEAARAVARQPSLGLGIGCTAITLAAMVWSAWIATGHDLAFLGPAGWAAIPLAALTAGLRTGLPSPFRGRASRPAAGSPARPAPAPSSEDFRA